MLLVAVFLLLDAFESRLAGVSGKSDTKNETVGEAFVMDDGVSLLEDDMVDSNCFVMYFFRHFRDIGFIVRCS